MARKRYKPDEIVSLLRQAEVLHGQGMSMPGHDPDRVPACGVRAWRPTRYPAGRAGTLRPPRWAA